MRMIICTAIILTIVTSGRIKCGHIENLSEDEDDEDYFGEAREATQFRDDFYRKRRSDEEGFYHTLLSRSEPQHVFKRSHGTEDFEHTNNAAFITERDWSGTSKISDADRKELESLFSKLNADDGDAKTHVTRSLPDEDNLSPLDNAAKTYSAWLMAQPASKLAAALTQKAQVDNKLTRLFFEKRGLDKLLPNEGLDLIHTNPTRLEGFEHLHPAHQPEIEKRTVIPEIVKVVKDKRTQIKGSNRIGNLTSSRLALENSDAKTLIMTGPKLCTDDSPKCLCTRGCYPNTAMTITPCKCDGNNKPNAPLKKSSLKNATSEIQSDITSKRVIDPYAKSWCRQACHPLSVVADNPCKCTGNLQIREKGLRQTVSTANTLNNLRPQIMPVEQPAKYVNTFPPHAPAIVKTSIAPAKPALTQMNNTVAARSQMSHSPANVTTPSNTSGKRNAMVSSQIIKAANQSEPAESKSIEPMPAKAPQSEKASGPEPAGLFGTKDPIYITHPSYQGCFKDRKPVRDLPKRYTRFDTTPEACISECKYQNYKFAGVQYGYLCFCGNAFGRYGRVADKDCNSYCNGDPKRRCGAFWHNSVYSVDGKSYDPSDFDFAKVDEEERLFDKLSPPAMKSAKRTSNKKETHANIQGVNAATHLMNAAQATLKAAQKLLPGVSKKQKIGKSGKRGKRDDNEEDAELMLERENVIASLKAVHQIIQKTNFERAKRNSEKEKRSINEDFDPYDPDDGKDLLKAYMSNVDAYNRQTRSVDEEEEDDETAEKDNFQYRRMSEGELDDGQFIDRYEDAPNVDDGGLSTTNKRSAEKELTDEKTKEKGATPDKNAQDHKAKPVNETFEEKRESISIPSEKDVEAANDSSTIDDETEKFVKAEGEKAVGATKEKEKKKEKAVVAKRSMRNASKSEEKTESKVGEGSGGDDRKRRRSLPEVKQVHWNEKVHISDKHRRNVPHAQIHATAYESSGVGVKGKRSLPNQKKTSGNKHHAAIEGSGLEEKKRRSVSPNEVTARKVFPVFDGMLVTIKKRDLSALNHNPSPLDKKKKRVLRKPAHVPNAILPWDRKKRSLPDALGLGESTTSLLQKRRNRSTRKVYNKGKHPNSRQRRDLTGNDVSDGALKMAARSDDINDIEASLQRLESIEKKDKIPADESAGESGSGESEDAGSGKQLNTTEQASKKSEISKRSAEKEKNVEGDKSNKIDENASDAKLRTDVEKGVDSLLNLVVELYKQQKTIKTFENSVRSLRHDILKELNLPTKDKHAATKKVREAIQAAAKNRLHILTTSIEHKITQFAKNHPESVKQAKLATTLLPHIPLSDRKLLESKREITRRSAEFDSIEDTFEEQTQLPSILKEHFKRNAENDVEEVVQPKKRSAEDSVEYEEAKTNEVNGEKTLSRMHRDVSESEEEGLDDDYEKLFI